MLCTIKFKAENQEDYSAEWGAVFSKEWGKRINNWSECQGPWTKKFDRKIYSSLEADIQKIWDVNKMVSFLSSLLRNSWLFRLLQTWSCVMDSWRIWKRKLSVSIRMLIWCVVARLLGSFLFEDSYLIRFSVSAAQSRLTWISALFSRLHMQRDMTDRMDCQLRTTAKREYLT